MPLITKQKETKKLKTTKLKLNNRINQLAKLKPFIKLKDQMNMRISKLHKKAILGK